jgi:hypothetical protein
MAVPGRISTGPDGPAELSNGTGGRRLMRKVGSDGLLRRYNCGGKSYTRSAGTVTFSLL